MAAVFHWPPHEMVAFDLTELMRWESKASVRSGQKPEH
nr:GpE family phage tail protein [Spongiibacter tropicus]